MGLRDHIKDNLPLPFAHRRGRSKSPARSVETHQDEGSQQDIRQHGLGQGRNEETAERDSSDRSFTQCGLRGLWNDAYQSLQKQNPDMLQAYERVLLEYKRSQDLDKATSLVKVDMSPPQRLEQIQSVAAAQLKNLSEDRLRFYVNGKEVVVREQVQKVVNTILSVKDVVSAAISSEPHASVAWAGVLVILPILGGTLQQDASAMEGLELISNLLVQFRFIENKFDFALVSSAKKEDREMIASIRKTTTDLYCQIYAYHIRLVMHYSHSTITRYCKDLTGAMGFSNWSNMLKGLKDTNEQIKRYLDTVNSVQTSKIYADISDIYENFERVLCEQKANRRDRILARLRYPEKALFDYFDNEKKPKCLENTQVLPLKRIQHWCEDENGKMILWLHGMAGTGKSTIARTIAWALRRKRWPDGMDVSEDTNLVATFFFQQGDEEISKAKALLPTIARCLVDALPLLEPYILDAVDSRVGIDQKGLHEQWEHLIMGPLSILDGSLSSVKRYVVVIDSLDECEDNDLIRPILRLFVQLKDLANIKLKILISSRPERHINNAFNTLPDECYHSQMLDKIQPGVDDITRFLTTELTRIAQRLPVPLGWPGPQNIQRLSTKTDGLFVYASTACRFLDSEDYYDARLEIIFSDEADGEEEDGYQSDSHESPQERLDKMYARILVHCIKGKRSMERKDLLANFKTIMGSILLLFKPLPLYNLACLLFGSYKDSKRHFDKVLAPLHSVIDCQYETNNIVRTLHLSFRDFLLDQKRCRNIPDFWIDQQETHVLIAEQCFDAMKELHQDMCQQKLPGLRVAKISATEVDKHLPLHVQYACRYWVDHLAQLTHEQRRSVGLEDNGRIHIFMQTKFLYWLEGLSLMKEFAVSILMLKRLHGLVDVGSNPYLSNLILDETRFVLSNRQIIEQAPLQIYSSALVFSPMQSLVRKYYSSLIPHWIEQLPSMEDRWTSELLVLEGHAATIGAVTCSLDGDLVVSKSHDGIICLWDSVTGVEKYRFQDSGGSTHCIALTQDGSMLASKLSQGFICLRTVATGETTLLECDGDDIKGLAFSPDGNSLVCLGDKTVRVWESPFSAKLCTFELNSAGWHRGEIVVDSCGFATICITDHDKWQAIRLDLTTGDLTVHVKNQTDDSPTWAFSPDGGLLAVMSGNEVQIWNAATGDLEHTTVYDNPEDPGLGTLIMIPTAIAVSSCGEVVAIGYIKGNIHLTNAVSGENIGLLDGHMKAVTTLSFFTGQMALVSGSEDRTVRLWDTASCRQIGEPRVSQSYKVDAMFLPRSEALLVRSITSPIARIWLFDPNTGKVGSYRKDLTKVRFSRDGRLVALVAGGAILQLTDSILESQNLDFIGIKDVSLSADGRLIACLRTDTIQILETENWEEIATLAAEDVKEVVLSPQGSAIVWVEKNRCCVCDLQTRDPVIDEPSWFWSFRTLVVFSPDERLVAVGLGENRISLWDVTRRKESAVLLLSDGDPKSLTFSPDSSFLVALEYRAVEVWETENGRKLHTFDRSPTNSLQEDMAISPSGLCAAPWKLDGRGIRVFEVVSGKERAFLKVDGRPRNLSFSDDEKYLYCDRGRLLLPFSREEESRHDVYVGRQWVRQGSQDLLWLPPAYRDVEVAVRGNLIAFANGLYWAQFLKLDLESTPFFATFSRSSSRSAVKIGLLLKPGADMACL